VAKEAGLSQEEIAAGIEAVKPVPGRMEIRTSGGGTVVRDCYNANPDSMRAALDFCDGLDSAPGRVYVLGSMLELGDTAQAAHREIAERAASSKAEAVFLYGNEWPTDLPPKFHCYTDFDAMSRDLGAYLAGKPEELVLIKASRGCHFERLDALFGEAA
jgi:UDP-N-acetylmuramoyl-tripeptide--D-alanyl-D-alanine ligase